MSRKLSQVVGGADLRLPFSRLDCCRSVMMCCVCWLDALGRWLEQLPSARWRAGNGARSWSRRRQWSGSRHWSRGLHRPSDLCLVSALQDTRLSKYYQYWQYQYQSLNRSYWFWSGSNRSNSLWLAVKAWELIGLCRIAELSWSRQAAIR